MVVDDDLSMCNFLRTFLTERGYHAITLGSAEEAVKRYHADRPAAVILDVVMPGSMDGLEALAAFKKIDREVPVIVLSGQGRTTTVVQAMKLGAADFVCKPFDEHDRRPAGQRAQTAAAQLRSGDAAGGTTVPVPPPRTVPEIAAGWRVRS
jgi:DNA-binding NtrC family response regulator